MLENTLNGQTLDIVSENVQKLKALFPEIVSEDKIDFEKLQAVLGEYIENDNERYNFTWNGKGRALRLSQTPSTGTLRPCKEESKEWDTTQNLYIEGDNLEVLKLLQKTYHNKIKMIYIDPPYNTGKDFVYPDDYKDNLDNYLRITGQKSEDGSRISTNSETSGRYHTNWLNMIYPRLRLARNLLSDDGVIFVSIDEHELSNLRFILFEIFGEDNWIADIVWQGGSKNDEQFFAISHEYILILSKKRYDLAFNGGRWEEPKEGIKDIYEAFDRIKIENPNNYQKQTQALKSWYSSLPKEHPSKEHSHYSWVDERGIYFPDNLSGPRFGQYRYDVIHPITGKICKEPSRGWVYPEKVMIKKIEEGIIHFGIDEKTVPCRKTYLKDHETKRPRSVIYKDGRAASGVVTSLLSQPKVFTNPKDHEVLGRLINLCVSENDIILDGFAGSSSTAHAVMQLNAEDSGNRKFIMIQLPEACGEETEAAKAGYKNICEIGKERIRRAGDKIKAELVEKQSAQQTMLDDGQTTDPESLDIGFKVFKLDSSNLKKWNPDYDNLEASLEGMVSNYVDGRSELDVVYEIMLKYGIDLTFPVEEYDFSGKKVYSIGFGALVICLDNDITTPLAQDIVKLKNELTPETMRVVFKDNGFINDAAKTNIKENLRQSGIDEFVTV